MTLIQFPIWPSALATAVRPYRPADRNRLGRLRPCANDECRLFLIDRSKANAARWCSMAACGNRMKARHHYQRTRDAPRPGRG